MRRPRKAGAEVIVIQPSARDLAVMGLNPMRGARVADVVQTVARLTAQPRLADLIAQ